MHFKTCPVTTSINFNPSIDQMHPVTEPGCFFTVVPDSKIMVNLNDGAFRVFTGAETMMVQGLPLPAVVGSFAPWPPFFVCRHGARKPALARRVFNGSRSPALKKPRRTLHRRDQRAAH